VEENKRFVEENFSKPSVRCRIRVISRVILDHIADDIQSNREESPFS